MRRQVASNTLAQVAQNGPLYSDSRGFMYAYTIPIRHCHFGQHAIQLRFPWCSSSYRSWPTSTRKVLQRCHRFGSQSYWSMWKVFIPLLATENMKAEVQGVVILQESSSWETIRTVVKHLVVIDPLSKFHNVPS